MSIEITGIKPPEIGWPVMAHCEVCQTTVIFLHAFAAKPDHGDIHTLRRMCVDEIHGIRHNLLMADQQHRLWTTWGPHPEDYTPEAYKAYWSRMGVE